MNDNLFKKCLVYFFISMVVSILFQNRCSQVQLRSDKMEMEMMEARVYRTPELNGDLSEDEDVEGEEYFKQI